MNSIDGQRLHHPIKYANPEEGKYKIYSLTDDRLREHLTDSKRQKHPVQRWVYELRLLDLEPILDILDIVEGDWEEAERWHIAGARSRGCRLVNRSAGGRGALGVIPNQAVREKLSRVHKGKLFSEEHKRRISVALRGLPKTASHRLSLSRSLLERFGKATQ